MLLTANYNCVIHYQSYLLVVIWTLHNNVSCVESILFTTHFKHTKYNIAFILMFGLIVTNLGAISIRERSSLECALRLFRCFGVWSYSVSSSGVFIVIC